MLVVNRALQKPVGAEFWDFHAQHSTLVGKALRRQSRFVDGLTNSKKRQGQADSTVTPGWGSCEYLGDSNLKIFVKS